MAKKRKSYLAKVSVILSLCLLTALFSRTEIFQKLEMRSYDALLALRPIKSECPEVAMLEIDDASLDSLGPWPWTRDIFADMLIRLKELGAETTIFDIEYLSPSKLAVNPEDAEFLLENIHRPDAESLAGQVFRDNDLYFARAIQFFENTYLTINTDQIISVSEEDEAYAKKRFLFTNVTDPGSLIKKSNGIFAKKSASNPGFSPARHEFVSRARGAGFTNIVIDPDGTRRRLQLLNAQDRGFTGQLVFAPLMDKLDVKEIIRKKSEIILKDAKIPSKNGQDFDDGRKDIKIPLDESGAMLIHWPKKKFEQAFRHQSVMIINQLLEAEKNLDSNIWEFLKLSLPDSDGLQMQYTTEATALAEEKNQLDTYRDFLLEKCTGFDENGQPLSEPVSQEEYDGYFEARREYFSEVEDFIRQNHLQKITERLVQLSDSGELSKEDSDSAQEFFALASEGVKNQYELYKSTFDSLKKELSGAFCIIGNTASGSTDLGSTPFNNLYPNIGTHANVYNTIVNEDFIKPLPELTGIIVISIVAILLAILSENVSLKIQNISGASVIIIFCATVCALMFFVGIYLPPISPLIIIVLTFLMLLAQSFFTAEKERLLIKNTFGAYVAPEVVSQIIENPEYAQVGGISKNLTALFSDVQKFSKFTEIVNNTNGEDKGAEQLVAVLNNYLGALSDAIQEQKGTIDKYVGDEIVSFFGAPIDDSDHAFHACIAGIRMLQSEAQINKEFHHDFKYPECVSKIWNEVARENGWGEKEVSEYRSYIAEYNKAGFFPMELRSRVGLNSGNMVVGNMGTERKLNYTIMGNNVNLASRLEGTNKAYGSWIMCSESTYESLKKNGHEKDLLIRPLDAVKVINVEKPVRIYSIVGVMGEMEEKRIRATEIFNQGVDFYMRGSEEPGKKKPREDLEEALKLFEQAEKLYPDDGSSRVFADRCIAFLKDGIPEIWDGVFTMATK